MTQPASPLATSPIASPQGSRLVTGPASDIASGPRANAPPPDLKGNARAAARRAGEAARNGASVADAIAQAKAPKTSEAAPSPEGVPSAPVEDSTSTPAGGSEEAGPPPAEETPSEIDYKTRVRQREQRMRRDLETERTQIASQRAELAEQQRQARAILDEHSRREQLRKTDIVKWAETIGLDEAALKPIVMNRIGAGKPEGKMLTLEQQVEQMRREREEEKQQLAQQQRRQQRAQSEAAFVDLARKNPIVAAAYGDKAGRLLKDAWNVQEEWVEEYGHQYKRGPTQQEILVSLENRLREIHSGAAKALQPAPAAPAPPPAPKPRVPSPSEQTRTAPAQRSERIETDRERKERAAREAKKAIAASNKRNVSQAR